LLEVGALGHTHSCAAGEPHPEKLVKEVLDVHTVALEEEAALEVGK
jgi:hypothetical protein